MPVDLRVCCYCRRAVARYHKKADTCSETQEVYTVRSGPQRFKSPG